MIRRLLAVLAITAGLVTALPASPAHATGWSPNFCAQDGSLDGDWRVCAQVHTVSQSGGGYVMDRVLVCLYHQAGGNSTFQGAKNAPHIQEYSSNGTPIGYLNTLDQAVGTCVNRQTGGYKGGPFSSGNGAFWVWSATADISSGGDRPMSVSGTCCW